MARKRHFFLVDVGGLDVEEPGPDVQSTYSMCSRFLASFVS